MLSKITHWPLSEILEMTEEDFYEWHRSAVAIQKEINGE
ncbi:MAG: GpE family phage tail protein [Alphaproteobacteria bacterium]|nr:GpE family phage tail protein [Alphaproteobacteria bacterium]